MFTKEQIIKAEIKRYGFELKIGRKERMALHNVLSNMSHRCYDSQNRCFHLYGGRGISICAEWYDAERGKYKYTDFIKWAIKSGWHKGLQLDRIDNEKGYSQNNCRWVSAKVNSNNRRSNRILTVNGERHTMSEWADRLGISYKALEHRVNRGMSDVEALTRPVTQGHETLITHNGITKNKKQWAKTFGLKVSTFSKRLKDGWSFERACNTENGHDQKAKKYTLDGCTLSAKEWALKKGITYGTLRRRIHRWGFQKAITFPYKVGV